MSAAVSIWERYIPEPNTGCWLWTGAARNDGRGWVGVPGTYRSTFAPRLAWVLTHGDIPNGLCVLHKCDTPACINPTHLFLGTRTDNSADKVAKGRQFLGPERYRRFTPKQVMTMRRMRMAGVSYAEIGRTFGTGTPHARRICLGERQKNVPGPIFDGNDEAAQ